MGSNYSNTSLNKNMRKNLYLVMIAVIITTMFLVAGIDKILHFEKVVGGFKKRLPIELPDLLNRLAILIAIVIEIVAPLALVYAAYNFENPETRKYGVYSALALVVFTVAATLIYHFPPFGATYYPFMSNLSTVGGLLLMAWVFSKKDN